MSAKNVLKIHFIIHPHIRVRSAVKKESTTKRMKGVNVHKSYFGTRSSVFNASIPGTLILKIKSVKPAPIIRYMI